MYSYSQHPMGSFNTKCVYCGKNKASVLSDLCETCYSANQRSVTYVIEEKTIDVRFYNEGIYEDMGSDIV